jgi:hypothetical protein
VASSTAARSSDGADVAVSVEEPQGFSRFEAAAKRATPTATRSEARKTANPRALSRRKGYPRMAA